MSRLAARGFQAALQPAVHLLSRLSPATPTVASVANGRGAFADIGGVQFLHGGVRRPRRSHRQHFCCRAGRGRSLRLAERHPAQQRKAPRFLNQLLYKHPEAFNDITTGGNEAGLRDSVDSVCGGVGSCDGCRYAKLCELEKIVLQLPASVAGRGEHKRRMRVGGGDDDE